MRVLILIAIAACGGSNVNVKTTGGKKEHVKFDAVKPDARREFEAGMRTLRNGGPEAGESAKPHFKEALKDDGSLWEAWHDLGVIAWGEGDDDEAIEIGRASCRERV